MLDARAPRPSFALCAGLRIGIIAADVYERIQCGDAPGAPSFLDMAGFNPLTMYREMKDLRTDDDGQLRKDWRMTHGECTEEHAFIEQ